MTLFIKGSKYKLLIVQVYVDDIIFRYKDSKLCKEFANLMSNGFELSMMEELIFFPWTSN